MTDIDFGMEGYQAMSLNTLKPGSGNHAQRQEASLIYPRPAGFDEMTSEYDQVGENR